MIIMEHLLLEGGKMEHDENITPEFVDKMAEQITGYIVRSGITELNNRDQAYILASAIVHQLCTVAERKVVKEQAQPLQVVTHRLKKGTIEELDRCVAEGGYYSRSALIREILESDAEKLLES